MFRRRRTGFFHVWALFRKIVGASEFTREVVARAGDVLGLIANISNLLPDCLYRLGIFGNRHNVGNGMMRESPVTADRANCRPGRQYCFSNYFPTFGLIAVAAAMSADAPTRSPFSRLVRPRA